MSSKQTAIVILAAGLGTRMKSSLPKVMHPIAGRPLISHVVATANTLEPARIVVVIGAEMAAVARAVAPHPTAIQHQRLGTAHAVLAAREALQGFSGDVLVMYGDTPLISAETLEHMLSVRRSPAKPAVVVLGFRPADPGPYGRLIVGNDGLLEAIVEAKDATAEQLSLPLCNSGVMVIDGKQLFWLLDRIDNKNAKGEYYLTDIIRLSRRQGMACAVVEGSEAELIGINSRADLAQAEAFVQARLRGSAMAEGATLVDPDTVFFSYDTRIGRDVTIGPYVVFGPGVTIGDNVEILPFSHLRETTVANGAAIGPFARLRPGAAIGEGAHVGNFVEIKNATVESGAKVNHLTYLGDARVGAGANVGAGTITCNYDGFSKSLTDIGVGAFIGSNSSLVAPVRIGDGAIVGAGSVVTRDVAADALAVARGQQAEKPGWAKEFRKRRTAEKARSGKVRG